MKAMVTVHSSAMVKNSSSVLSCPSPFERGIRSLQPSVQFNSNSRAKENDTSPIVMQVPYI